jgi:AraC-like DNA-binding protein
MLEGRTTLLQPGGKTVRLDVGDVLLLPRGVGHGLASSPDVPLIDAEHPGRRHASGPVTIGPDQPAARGPRSRMLCGTYRLDTSRQAPLLRRLPASVVLETGAGRHPELSAVVGLLVRELTQSAPGGPLAAGSLLDLLLVETLRAWFRQHPYEEWATELSDPPIADALRYLHAHPQRSWTVAELAAAVGLSRAAFARRFTDRVGQPPLAYLTSWRMLMASRLLRDENRVLADVAHSVGYSSPYAFANAFKRVHGVAPGTYRQNSAIHSRQS